MDQPFQEQLIAGDTWDFTVSLDNYTPAAGYTLKYFFRGAGTKLDITATATSDNLGFNVHATPTQTIALSAGLYDWQAKVTKGADSTEVGRGQVEILADIASGDGSAETRSAVKIQLDNITAVLNGTSGRKEQEYQINGRMLRLIPFRELKRMQGQLKFEYQQELIASGQESPNARRVQVRFS